MKGMLKILLSVDTKQRKGSDRALKAQFNNSRKCSNFVSSFFLSSLLQQLSTIATTLSHSLAHSPKITKVSTCYYDKWENAMLSDKCVVDYNDANKFHSLSLVRHCFSLTFAAFELYGSSMSDQSFGFSRCHQLTLPFAYDSSYPNFLAKSSSLGFSVSKSNLSNTASVS